MHTATGGYWKNYNALPKEIQDLAKFQFDLMNNDPSHPSLHLKRVKTFWSVRIIGEFRALGKDIPGGIIWFWIGEHREYDRLIG